MALTFGSSKKIKSRKLFEKIFSEGKGFTVFPFKILYVSSEESGNSNLKFGFSVPKKRFKRAVDRNLLKRRTREAVRLHLNDLENTLKSDKKACYIVLIYISNNILSYQEIEHKIILSLQRLKEQYA